MKKNLIMIVSLAVASSMMFTSTTCFAAEENNSEVVITTSDDNEEINIENTDTTNEVSKDKTESTTSEETTSEEETTYNITLAEDASTSDSENVSIENNIITIKAGGTYVVSGTLTNGQIIVDSEDENDVELDFQGVNITCDFDAPIYVANAENCDIKLEKGTENTITDNRDATNEDEDSIPAAIYSKDDLKIKGKGTLTVNANYNSGITSKNDITIQKCTLNVNAVNNGIKGKDSVEMIEGAVITVNSTSDGIKSTNDTDEGKGYVLIDDATVNVTSSEDGISAETNLTINSGEINLVTGSGSAGTIQTVDGEEVSCKGLKASQAIEVNGGYITIDSCDDSVHSNGTIVINDGTFKLNTGDDGIHADTELTINNGTIDIEKCYEGLESDIINIVDGSINIVASDDGINAADGSSSSSDEFIPNNENQTTITEQDRTPGGMMKTGDSQLNISGGYIVVDASGDGLDANGNITMTGGTVIVNGPTSGGDGAIDYDGTFDISGGTLIAAGSSQMAQSVSDTSTQYTINYRFTSTQKAGTIFRLVDENGNNIVTFAPTKEYQSVVVSSPNLTTGNYKVYSGGTCDGEVTDGLYSDGNYSGETELTSFTISSINTNIAQDGSTFDSNEMGGPGQGGQIPGQGGNGQPPIKPDESGSTTDGTTSGDSTTTGEDSTGSGNTSEDGTTTGGNSSSDGTTSGDSSTSGDSTSDTDSEGSTGNTADAHNALAYVLSMVAVGATALFTKTKRKEQ